MSLDTRPPRQTPVRRVATPRERDEERGLPTRSLLSALVLACVALMVVDASSGAASPVDPVRRFAGEVLGPVQAGASNLLDPILGIPGWFRTNDGLRGDLADAQRRIADLEAANHQDSYLANRADELGRMCALVDDTGYAVAPARVIGYGSAQSFSNTVTIDAGTDAGLHADMTVVNPDGLVGRVIQVSSHTATVLLVIDASSTVGGRVGDTMENGMVSGHGGLADDQPLELQLIDHTIVPQKGQPVVTWGSEGGAPYVSGVPIGEVSKVFQDLRLGTYRTVLEPYVDFTSLDDVGVVVPTGGAGGAGVIEPGACS
ncbi:rod shape-determining protein MreC [Nocardioides sp. MH1]|uniref:rod shape-determining protein MreC n=1 Tax=Nocardioides sp. MH1 TaxID=3242490 RepID=UPI00351FE962